MTCLKCSERMIKMSLSYMDTGDTLLVQIGMTWDSL